MEVRWKLADVTGGNREKTFFKVVVVVVVVMSFYLLLPHRSRIVMEISLDSKMAL